MNRLSKFYYRMVIGRQLKKLPALLYQRYGKCEAYTEPHIRKTMEVHQLPPHYPDYSLAWFMAPEVWQEFQADATSSDYFDMVPHSIEKFGLTRPDPTWSRLTSGDFSSDACADSFDSGGGDG